MLSLTCCSEVDRALLTTVHLHHSRAQASELEDTEHTLMEGDDKGPEEKYQLKGRTHKHVEQKEEELSQRKECDQDGEILLLPVIIFTYLL